jgi:hypothetical protein
MTREFIALAEVKKLLTMVAMLSATACCAQAGVPEADLRVDLTKPALWTVDTVHLGNHQLELRADATEPTLTIKPLWSSQDRSSEIKGISNVETSRLHIYQLMPVRDCTQVEVEFEVNMPREYVEEGKMQLVFSLQAGAQGDYLFNGRTFTMADFANSAGRYKKIRIVALDFNEPEDKLRAIERINLLLHRRGSMVSAPIGIRNLGLRFHTTRIVPPAPEAVVVNPKSFYSFAYDNASTISAIAARISDEDLDVGRSLDAKKAALKLSPQWAPGQLPPGHSGKVTLAQPLGGIHNFDRFEVKYAMNIPKAYFDEGKLNLYLFVQAGSAGYGRWSGAERKLATLAGEAGNDVVLTLTDEDFRSHGKKRNQIEVVGLQLIPNGSKVTDPIILKSITVNLPSSSSKQP